MKRHAIPLGGVAIVVAMAACQAATEGAQKPADAASAASEMPVARLAIDALSAELGIPKDRIEVESVTAVDWPDGSLGCPKPGMGYLTVITPGHRIALRADGTTYAVHEAGGRAIVCLQASAAPGPAPVSNQLQFGRQFQLARKDLAGRLAVPESALRLSGATPAVWDDASLGCPEPGVQYAQMETTGWILVLKQGDREFKYHADGERAIPCPPISAD
jgi:hypothetical protein